MMENNRYAQHKKEIREISERENVDIGVACAMLAPARDVHRNAARSVPHLRSAQVFPCALRGRCRKIPAPAHALAYQKRTVNC